VFVYSPHTQCASKSGKLSRGPRTGKGQFSFYIHRGPIKERNGQAAVRFQEVDASRTKKKGFEERE